MAKKNLKKGLFITFEGFEGSGKSTQIRLLFQFLKKNGYPVLILREPGSTNACEAIRRLLLDKKNRDINREAELLLYLASRAQLVREKINPALAKKYIVLCDRFHDATVAYQGWGLDMDRKFIDILGRFAKGGTEPNLTILFDIDIKEGLRRAGGDKDRIESRSAGYHRRVRKGYLRIAKAEPARVKVIKVDQGITDIQAKVRALVEKLLKQRRHKCR